MTDTAERTTPSTDAVEEVRSWLEENWDPDLTVAEWWERLGLSGWAAPGLPENAYGKGLNRNDAVAVQNAIAAFGALGAPGGLGLLLAAPTFAHHSATVRSGSQCSSSHATTSARSAASSSALVAVSVTRRSRRAAAPGSCRA